jgi:hypothetical protein
MQPKRHSQREPTDVIHLSSDEDDCVRPARQPSEIRRRVQISIETSLTIRPDKTRLEDGTYGFVYPWLRRKVCGHPSHITIGEDSYYHARSHGTVWWEQALVNTASYLFFHENHREDLIYCECPYPDSLDDVFTLPLDAQVNHIIALVFKGSHYRVIELDFRSRVSVIPTLGLGR